MTSSALRAGSWSLPPGTRLGCSCCLVWAWRTVPPAAHSHWTAGTQLKNTATPGLSLPCYDQVILVCLNNLDFYSIFFLFLIIASVILFFMHPFTHCSHSARLWGIDSILPSACCHSCRKIKPPTLFRCFRAAFNSSCHLKCLNYCPETRNHSHAQHSLLDVII